MTAVNEKKLKKYIPYRFRNFTDCNEFSDVDWNGWATYTVETTDIT